MSVSVKVTTKSFKFRGVDRPLRTVGMKHIPHSFSPSVFMRRLSARVAESRLMNTGGELDQPGYREPDWSNQALANPALL